MTKTTTEPTEGTLTRVDDIETTPQGTVRRWCAELTLAEQTESDWRKEAEDIYDKYEAEEEQASAFCILWSNTEILSAAIYNSTPKPDVRRRFRDDDPVGKAVAKVLERSVAYEIDDYDFDDEIDSAVLDVLLVGRGIVRVKYEPKFAQIPVSTAPPVQGAADPNAQGAYDEKLTDQKVPCEHVQWKDFRRGSGKRWRDLPWIAFRHDFTHEMAEEQFGPEIAAALQYEQGEGVEDATKDKGVQDIFKVCVVWEIWDKDRRRVLFIAPTYKAGPCLEVQDPLHLKGFWPMPRPAYAVRNSRTLVPVPLYRLYKQQAIELDTVSARINRIVTALKLRGAYNAALTELKEIFSADDTDMLPIENAAMVAETGGLDKNIWIMPVDQLIVVLKGLYEARAQIKQTIYEIIGIGDILRGASDPTETAKAQQIKSQWGSIRVQKTQREIQRMVRDLMRLKAEVIAQQFTQEQFAAITQVQLPTAQQKQQAGLVIQQAQMSGEQPPPDAVKVMQGPAWEDVMQVLRSDELRCYRVDVETDSTVAETIDRDMTGLGELLASLSGWVEGAFAAVQQGAMTVETMKEIALAVIRRARLGSAVEDAFEQLKAPPQQAPDQGEQLKAMEQKILDIIKGEGARLSATEQDVASREQNVANTVGQITQGAAALHQGAQQLGQGAQITAAHAIEQQQTTQVERQLLVELAQVLQALGSADQGTRGQVNQAMTQVAGAVQGVMQALNAVTEGLQQMQALLAAPKKVVFERDTNNRIKGATASI
jgi:hypothetical protein